MPDVPVAPAAPAATPTPAPAPASAPAPKTPSITFGDSKPVIETPAPVTAPKETPEADLKFDFGFDGEQPADAPPVADGEVDYSKPFDPALEELLKNSPEQLKQAKAAWYDNRAWKASGFKSAQELKAHVQKVDMLANSLGRADGTKGLAAIEAEAKEWQSTYEGFQNGDEGVVKQWFQDVKPEVAEKLLVTADSQLKEKNPNGWSRLKARDFMSELRSQDNSGQTVLASLNRLVQVSKDNPEAMELLKSIGATVNQLDEISRQAPSAPAADQREQQLSQKERSLFVRELSGRIMPQIGTAAQKAAKVVLGSRQVGQEAAKTFALEVQTEYNRLTKQDPEFQKTAKSYLDANDQEGFERLVRSNITRVMPTAAKNIHRKYTGFNSEEMARRREEGASRVEGAAGGSQAGAGRMPYKGKLIQGGPDPAVVDWNRMRAVTGSKTAAEDMMFERRFFVKGEKSEYYW